MVSQTDGVTPLQMASMEGHVECVRALLDGGAAINQAMVGCASSVARLFPRDHNGSVLQHTGDIGCEGRSDGMRWTVVMLCDEPDRRGHAAAFGQSRWAY